MSNPYYSEFPERSATTKGPAAPKLGTPGPVRTLSRQTWKAPARPGSPRTVFKAHGRRVKTHPQGDV